MKIRTLAVLATAVLLPLGAAACGGGDGGSSGGKPSVDAITKKFVEAHIPEKQANCLAQAMHDNLSAATLTKIMKGDTSGDVSADVGKELSSADTAKMAGAMGKCYSGASN